MKTNRGSNYRYKLFWIDFCWDGMFPKPRIKGKDKRRLGKRSRKEVQNQFMKEEEE